MKLKKRETIFLIVITLAFVVITIIVAAEIRSLRKQIHHTNTGMTLLAQVVAESSSKTSIVHDTMSLLTQDNCLNYPERCHRFYARINMIESQIAQIRERERERERERHSFYRRLVN